MLIAVDGNLGSGKSTVLAELQHRGYTVVPEPVGAWGPMLELMYADPARWTLTFQTQVLAHYADVKRRYADTAGPVFVERSPVSALVFVSLATHRNALTVDELTVYMELHAAIGWEPDATVFIATSVDECYRRVLSRARRGESTVSRDYIAKVAMLYAQSPASQEWRVDTADPVTVAATILAKLGLPGRCGRTRSFSV